MNKDNGFVEARLEYSDGESYGSASGGYVGYKAGDMGLAMAIALERVGLHPTFEVASMLEQFEPEDRPGPADDFWMEVKAAAKKYRNSL